MEKVNIYTDLAIESREMIPQEEELDGVKITVDEKDDSGITVTWVEVNNEEGALRLNKPIGNYITIESEAMKETHLEIHEEIAQILAGTLNRLHKLGPDSVILVIGLGNWQVTPDALGPRVVSKVLVTRHISGTGEIPAEVEGKVRSVCAISPGVMGLTGIETAEIVRGIASRVKPDLLVAVDALAARKTNRINATIQISDTGVNPGAGLGNKRMAINSETIGVPVIAMGVPTVVDAATLVNDTMDKILSSMIHEAPQGSGFYEMLMNLADEEKYHLIKEILNPYSGNMFVTPKDVDAVMDRLSNIIANSLNMALHPGITAEDMNRYLAS